MSNSLIAWAAFYPSLRAHCRSRVEAWRGLRASLENQAFGDGSLPDAGDISAIRQVNRETPKDIPEEITPQSARDLAIKTGI
ncbi:hypothetical protein [Pseudomonas bohemica]|uniref:hypothetical protein n=1 Tax=Pseudomonas bohemica TaxID=2044872 RepID=UPI000DA62F9D|nr:hypothetical protein [Pseudomonas bohemica]